MRVRTPARIPRGGPRMRADARGRTQSLADYGLRLWLLGPGPIARCAATLLAGVLAAAFAAGLAHGLGGDRALGWAAVVLAAAGVELCAAARDRHRSPV